MYNNDPILDQIINELPLEFVNLVLEEADLATLIKMKARYSCYNRLAVIEAQIENIELRDL